MKRYKLIRLTTIPLTINILLKNQLKFLSNYFEIIVVSSPGKDLLEVKKREGVKIHPIKINREISLIPDIISFIKILYFLYKEKPNIVHTIQLEV